MAEYTGFGKIKAERFRGLLEGVAISKTANGSKLTLLNDGAPT